MNASATSFGAAVGALRRAAKAGRLAEQAVERHRGEGQPDHAGHDREQQHDGRAVAAPMRPAISLATAHAHDADDVEQRHQRQQHGEQRAVARADAALPFVHRAVTDGHPPLLTAMPRRDAVGEQHGEDQKQVQQREMEHVPRAALAGLVALAPHLDRQSR